MHSSNLSSNGFETVCAVQVRRAGQSQGALGSRTNALGSAEEHQVFPAVLEHLSRTGGIGVKSTGSGIGVKSTGNRRHRHDFRKELNPLEPRPPAKTSIPPRLGYRNPPAWAATSK